MMAANRSYKKPERFRCPRCHEHRQTPEANLIVRHPRAEEPQKRRVTDKTGKSGTDTHKEEETGHSGHENHKCGEIMAAEESR